MATKSMKKLMEEGLRSNTRRMAPFSNLLIAAEIQILSGMLHVEGFESIRMFEGRLDGHGGNMPLRDHEGNPKPYKEHELERELKHGPQLGYSVSIKQSMLLVAEVYANQMSCDHEMKTTGHHVPMGSFTASEEQCTCCGYTRMND